MAHLAVFDVKALLAADAAFEDESLTCDVAKVSGIVTSLERNFSFDHGITVTPSGLFPSVLQTPKGSFYRYFSTLNCP